MWTLIKTSNTEVYTISKLINLIKTEINIVIYNNSIDIEEIKPRRGLPQMPLRDLVAEAAAVLGFRV